MMRSAAPEPYISAVSMWVMPRSSPRRSAATASAADDSSERHEPWPTTATSRRVEPKVRKRVVCPAGFMRRHSWDGGAEAARHFEGRLAPLIIARNHVQRIEAEPLIKMPRGLVLRPQLQVDAEDAGLDGGGGEPLHDPTAETLPAMLRGDREEIEVRDLVAEVHDAERGDAGVAPRHHD